MDDVFLFSRGRNHVVMMLRLRRGCRVPSSLFWPSIKKSDDIEKLAMTGSVDGFNVLPEIQFVRSRLCVDTTLVLSVGGSLPLWELPKRDQSLTSICF